MIGLDLVHDTLSKVKIIRERLVATQSRKKAYVDNRRRELEFMVGDMVFLNVSSMKGIMWLEIRGKLSPRYIKQYEIIKRVVCVAYWLALPSNWRSTPGIPCVNVKEISAHPISFHLTSRGTVG